MTRLILIAFAILLLPASNASAGSIAHCGGSSGYAYYIQGGLVTEKKSGWGEDGISKGQILLIQDGKEFDIIHTDASGGTRSSKGDGGKVIAVGRDANSIMLIVIYPGKTVESYLFRQHGKSGEVVWTQMKLDDLISKAQTFKADCAFK